MVREAVFLLPQLACYDYLLAMVFSDLKLVSEYFPWKKLSRGDVS
jgi:hypothetical protein